jgi:hypothetical protein
MSEVIQLLVSASTLGAVFFAWRGIDQTQKWEKIKAIALFLDAKYANELLDDATIQCERISVSITDVIAAESAALIYNDKACRRSVTRYLTYYERFASVVNAGAIDSQLAYEMAVGEITGVHHKFEAYIDYKRESLNDHNVMIQLSRLSQEWSAVLGQSRLCSSSTKLGTSVPFLMYSEDWRHFDNLIWQVPSWSSAIFTLTFASASIFISSKNSLEEMVPIDSLKALAVFVTSIAVVFLLLINVLTRFRLHRQALRTIGGGLKGIPKTLYADTSLMLIVFVEFAILVGTASLCWGLNYKLSCITGVFALICSIPLEWWIRKQKVGRR